MDYSDIILGSPIEHARRARAAVRMSWANTIDCDRPVTIDELMGRWPQLGGLSMPANTLLHRLNADTMDAGLFKRVMIALNSRL